VISLKESELKSLSAKEIIDLTVFGISKDTLIDLNFLYKKDIRLINKKVSFEDQKYSIVLYQILYSYKFKDDRILSLLEPWINSKYNFSNEEINVIIHSLINPKNKIKFCLDMEINPGQVDFSLNNKIEVLKFFNDNYENFSPFKNYKISKGNERVYLDLIKSCIDLDINLDEDSTNVFFNYFYHFERERILNVGKILPKKANIINKDNALKSSFFMCEEGASKVFKLIKNTEQIISSGEFDNFKHLKNKRVKKELLEKALSFKAGRTFYNHIPYDEILKIKGILPEIDEQILLPLIDSLSSEFYLLNPFLYEKLELLTMCLKELPHKKIIRLLVQSLSYDYIELDDILIMHRNLQSVEGESFDLNNYKIKNIRDLHKLLTLETSKISQEDYLLNQNINELEGVKFNSYSIQIPKTSHDLIETGILLDHCVGNGYYAEKVLRKDSQIFNLVKENRIVYTIEVDMGYRIIQAKGKSNHNLNQAEKEELQKLVLDRLL
tara:strand:- start:24315 stop:25802 length:1488 start_codon:yes stop_codon:yes gene_type:complete